MNNINIVKNIKYQIERMRNACVEPFEVVVSIEVHEKLGKPKTLYGVRVECDRNMKGWAVR